MVGHESDTRKSEAAIRAWLTETISALLQIDPEEVRPRAAFADLGLESVSALQLIGRVEQEYGCPVDPAELMSHPNTESFARFIAAQL